MNDPTPIASVVRPLLSVRRLRVRAKPRGLLKRGAVRLIDNLDLDLLAGECLAIIGEAGCGKSTLARVIAGQQSGVSGSIRFDGEELVPQSDKEMPPRPPSLQVFSSDWSTRLRRKTPVGRVLDTALQQVAPELNETARRLRAETLLLRVGMLPSDAARAAQSLSPLEHQRVALALALAAQPRLLVADEPADRLDDADEQRAFLEQLVRACREDGIAVMLMGRDPAQVRVACDRLMVLYLGRVMEQGEREAIFDSAAHPYTRALLATPLTRAESGRGETRLRLMLEGAAPDPSDPPIGCVFHPRCPMAEAACVRQVPHAHRTGATPRHYAACLFAPQPRPQAGERL